MKTARYVADARAKGVPVTKALTKSLKRQLTRLRNSSDGLINGQAKNWVTVFWIPEKALVFIMHLVSFYQLHDSSSTN